MRPRLCSLMMACVQVAQRPQMQLVQANDSLSMLRRRHPAQYIWTGPEAAAVAPADEETLAGVNMGELLESREDGFMIWN